MTKRWHPHGGWTPTYSTEEIVERFAMTDAEREAQIRKCMIDGVYLAPDQGYLLHLLDEARAEIVRLQAAVDAVPMTAEDAFDRAKSICAVNMPSPDGGLIYVKYLPMALRAAFRDGVAYETSRLQAPPGASAVARAACILEDHIKRCMQTAQATAYGEGMTTDHKSMLVVDVAHAIEEAEREAIEEAAKTAIEFTHDQTLPMDARTYAFRISDAIRALADNHE